MVSLTLTDTPGSSFDDYIHIALVQWDLAGDYCRHAGVMLLSLLEHTSSPVIVHLLHGESSSNIADEAYNKACLSKICESHGAVLYYHPVEVPEWFYEIPAVKQFTPGTLLRLSIPEILYSVNKVIYLDSDMVALTDVHDLWVMPLKGNYIAARVDMLPPDFSTRRVRFYRRKGISVDNYFNSGIFVMDLAKMRHDNISFKDIAYTYLRHNMDLPYLDQDVLNWFCNGKFLRLPPKYNVYIPLETREDFSGDCILHYLAHNAKPWDCYHGSIDDPYWEYFFKTPWCDSIINLVEYVRRSPNMNECILLLQKNFLKYQSGNILSKLKVAYELCVGVWKNIFNGFIRILKRNW